MNRLIGLILFSSLFFSCSDALYEKNIDFPDTVWEADTSCNFNFTIDDIESEYEVSYIIRNNLEYPYYNLFLQNFIYDENDIKVNSEIQEVILMNKKTGRPYGKGFSGIYQNSFIAYENLTFDKKGKYTFKIKHYMRGKNISGIVSVGIKLSKKAEK